jgi:hypothetical protein
MHYENFDCTAISHTYITTLELNMPAAEHSLALVLCILRSAALPLTRLVITFGPNLEYRPFPKTNVIGNVVQATGLSLDPRQWRFPSHLVSQLQAVEICFIQVGRVHTKELFLGIFSELEKRGILRITPEDVFEPVHTASHAVWGPRIRGVTQADVAQWRGQG